MAVLILSLLALCLVAFVAGYVRNNRLKQQLQRGEIAEMPHITKARPDGCCGKHAVCEKEQLLAAFETEVEYYDDEELDAYKGRPSNSYTDAEAALFEEVLTTMQTAEVAAWMRSLQLRGIELPDQLKDEAIMLMADD